MPTMGSGTYARLARSDGVLHQRARPRPARTSAAPWPCRATTSSTTSRGSRSPLGAPVLDDAVAQIHCTAAAARSRQVTTTSCCAEVEALEVSRPVTPLLFFQGGYGGFSPGGMAARGDADLIAAVRLGRHRARTGRAARARRLGCEAAGPGRRRPRRAHHHLQRLRRHRRDGRAARSAHPADPADRRGLRRRAPSPTWSTAGCPRSLRRTPTSSSATATRLAAVERRGAAVSMVGAARPVRSTNGSGEALAEYGTGELTPGPRAGSVQSCSPRPGASSRTSTSMPDRELRRRRHRRPGAQPRGRHLDGAARHPAPAGQPPAGSWSRGSPP